MPDLIPTPDPRSVNPVKHGLFAHNPVLKGESIEEYRGHIKRVVDDIKPRGAQETLVAQRIADATWRLNRIPDLETRIDEMAPEAAVKYLSLLSLYEGRLERKVQGLYKLLHTLQAEAEKTNLPQILLEKRNVKGAGPKNQPSQPGTPQLTLHLKGIRDLKHPALPQLIREAERQLARATERSA